MNINKNLPIFVVVAECIEPLFNNITTRKIN